MNKITTLSYQFERFSLVTKRALGSSTQPPLWNHPLMATEMKNVPPADFQINRSPFSVGVEMSTFNGIFQNCITLALHSLP